MKRQFIRIFPMKRFASHTLKSLSMIAVLSTTVSAVDAASSKNSALRAQPVASTTLRAQRAAPKNGLAIRNRQGGAGKPDLIILPRYSGNSGLPHSGYCGAWNGGNQKVQFYVKNVGSVASPNSVVQVNFGGSNYGTIGVPSLAPNQQTLRSRSIPSEAWGPSPYHASVQFLIAADHNDDMVEDSETNNYGQSTCMGPAG